MIIVMSPAKTFKETREQPRSIPFFDKEATQLINHLRSCSDETLAKGMHLSKSLLRTLRDDLDTYGTYRYPAVHMYAGQAMKSFWTDDIKDHTYVETGQRLLILSGLYGVLRAFDGISRYRLEMKDRTIRHLYPFWMPKVHQFFKTFHADRWIVNLASKEYDKLIVDLPKVITIRFELISEGRHISPSMMAKTMRGLMARWIIDTKIDTPEALKRIHLDGFTLDSTRSDDTLYVYTKEV